MEHRHRAVLGVLAGEAVTAVAARYSASRQTIYAWVERYRDEDLVANCWPRIVVCSGEGVGGGLLVDTLATFAYIE